jgi:hypothetical protein
VLLTSHNMRQSTGDSGLPELSGCHRWPPYWKLLFFPHSADSGTRVFKFFSHFAFQRLCALGHNTTQKQFNSILFLQTACYRYLKQKVPANTLYVSETSTP